jgi:asparagine synthase (glutamine-hydrolysing)
MCGIVGIAGRSPRLTNDDLINMRETLRHRGPDDAGVWWAKDGQVGLAHRRLAIIDLSPRGRQPMSDASGRFRITFNGEIYNYLELRRELQSAGHSFRTASDTEVLLEAYRAWGPQCLSRVNGMFAFGLYDTKTQRLLLARDRAGEKPLYYCHTPGQLVFASELKAIMADPTFPRTLDLEALDSYLAYGYVPGDLCMLKGARKLPQGHALMYDVGTDRIHVWRYWDLPAPCQVPGRSSDELCEELEERLQESVRLRLIADVPIGVLLSGGIDSSLVTAMAARVSSKPVKTFTVSFPGHGTYNEAPYARLVARHFGTEHIETAADPSVVELLPELARQYDEPLGDSSLVPSYLVSRIIRQHATVALGGDGGDELFGGYWHYSWLQQQDRIRRRLPESARSVLQSIATRLMPMGMRGRNYVMGLTTPSSAIAQINVFFDFWTRRRLLVPELIKYRYADGEPERYRAGLCVADYSILRQATEADFRTTFVDAYLVKVDRASMLASLEVRCPWLDHRIIEFAYQQVPDNLRATEHKRKILASRFAQKVLPADLDLERKQGFSMPLTHWFKGKWGQFVEAVLKESDPHFFNHRFIERLIYGQRLGFLDHTSRLFALTMFELWRREYKITI